MEDLVAIFRPFLLIVQQLELGTLYDMNGDSMRFDGFLFCKDFGNDLWHMASIWYGVTGDGDDADIHP